MANTKKQKSSRSKSTAKSTRARANSNSAGSSTSSNSGAFSASANSAKDAYKNMSAQFMNPSQFFNTSSFGNFKAANVQQWMEQFMETSQKNMEALTACTQMAVERAKDMMEEQANFTSKLLQETTSTFQETMANGADPKVKMDEIADFAKYCMEKTATAARKATEDNIEIAQKIGSTLNKRLNESVEEIRSSSAA